MAISKTNFNAIIQRISKENNIELEVLCNQFKDLYTPKPNWGSKAAKDLYNEYSFGIDKIIPTGKDGKIVINDVKLAAAENKVSDEEEKQ